MASPISIQHRSAISCCDQMRCLFLLSSKFLLCSHSCGSPFRVPSQRTCRFWRSCPPWRKPRPQRAFNGGSGCGFNIGFTSFSPAPPFNFLLRFAAFAFFAFITVSPLFAFSLLPALRFAQPRPPYLQPARQTKPASPRDATPLFLQHLASDASRRKSRAVRRKTLRASRHVDFLIGRLNYSTSALDTSPSEVLLSSASACTLEALVPNPKLARASGSRRQLEHQL
jgi:hypothetical protein